MKGFAYTSAYVATWDCFVEVTVILRFSMFLDSSLFINLIPSDLETMISLWLEIVPWLVENSPLIFLYYCAAFLLIKGLLIN